MYVFLFSHVKFYKSMAKYALPHLEHINKILREKIIHTTGSTIYLIIIVALLLHRNGANSSEILIVIQQHLQRCSDWLTVRNRA